MPCCAAITLLLLSAVAGNTRAQEATGPLRVQGLSPDAELVGGGGFAFDGALDNYFLARARLGALYAREPWIANLGLTVEVGALARLGVGGEVELNGPYGVFGKLGVARVDGSAWMGHAGIGWLVFGIEWQHRFESATPHDALMFHVRMPLGIWWFKKRRQHADEERIRAHHSAFVHPLTPGVNPSPPPKSAKPTVPTVPPAVGGPSAAPPAVRTREPAPDTERDMQREASLAEARDAHTRGDWAAEAAALTKAYEASGDPQLAVQLAAAEEQRGRWLAALVALRRALLSTRLAPEARAETERHHGELVAKLPHLRLIVRGDTSGIDVSIDGVAEPSALVGYDVPIDPGTHEVSLRRGATSVAVHTIQAREGELVRLSIDLPVSVPTP
ncbi:MAG: hypothetical protein ABW321_02070 [Polyangiales bacterium]